MEIKCDICDEILTKQGALLFSPPRNKKTKKIHICTECYFKVTSYLRIKND